MFKRSNICSLKCNFYIWKQVQVTKWFDENFSLDFIRIAVLYRKKQSALLFISTCSFALFILDDLKMFQSIDCYFVLVQNANFITCAERCKQIYFCEMFSDIRVNVVIVFCHVRICLICLILVGVHHIGDQLNVQISISSKNPLIF